MSDTEKKWARSLYYNKTGKLSPEEKKEIVKYNKIKRNFTDAELKRAEKKYSDPRLFKGRYKKFGGKYFAILQDKLTLKERNDFVKKYKSWDLAVRYDKIISGHRVFIREKDRKEKKKK